MSFKKLKNNFKTLAADHWPFRLCARNILEAQDLFKLFDSLCTSWLSHYFVRTSFWLTLAYLISIFYVVYHKVMQFDIHARIYLTCIFFKYIVLVCFVIVTRIEEIVCKQGLNWSLYASYNRTHSSLAMETNQRTEQRRLFMDPYFYLFM